jgi:hypothetical protein
MDAVNLSYSHVPQLIAVSSQSEYKGLTPIQVIGRAIAERTEIPWAHLLDRYVTLAEELRTASQFIKEVGADKYAGVKYGGLSLEIKNLLYLCVKALVILGGEESLRNYGGIGGDSSTVAVPMRPVIDSLIEKLKERQTNLPN